MIKSIRIHHTSDGGMLEIGASDKTVIEVNGVRFSLAALLQVGGLVSVDKQTGELCFTPHECPKPEPKVEAETKPDPRPARKKAAGGE